MSSEYIRIRFSGDPKAVADTSFRNRNRLVHGVECGCYNCTKIFPSDEIVDWWDDEQTAVCPYCGIDSVIDGEAGRPLTEGELRSLRAVMFGPGK